MKKLICFILALTMICLLTSSLAEELDLDSIEFTAPAVLTEIPEKVIKESSFAVNPNADQVVCENNVYTVTTPELVLSLDMSKNKSIRCYTQDFLASLDVYFSMDKAEEFIQFLIDNKIHFNLWDPETDNDVYIFSKESDSLSRNIGDFSSLSESLQRTIQQKTGADDVVKTGDISWLYIAASPDRGIFHTFVNGTNLVVQFGGSGDLEGDLDDTILLLSNLTIK